MCSVVPFITYFILLIMEIDVIIKRFNSRGLHISRNCTGEIVVYSLLRGWSTNRRFCSFNQAYRFYFK